MEKLLSSVQIESISPSVWKDVVELSHCLASSSVKKPQLRGLLATHVRFHISAFAISLGGVAFSQFAVAEPGKKT